jgi:hypothetical protein
VSNTDTGPGGNVEAGHQDLKKTPSVDFGCRLGWKVDIWFGGGRTKIEGDVQGFASVFRAQITIYVLNASI